MPRLKPAALVAIAVTLACGDDTGLDTTGPQATNVPDPGFVNVSLTSPNSNDGALLIQLSGGEIDSLIGATASMFAAETGSNTFRIFVAGTIPDGPVLRFWVPDRRDLSPYTATLEQAATRGTYVQQDISSYALSVER